MLCPAIFRKSIIEHLKEGAMPEINSFTCLQKLLGNSRIKLKILTWPLQWLYFHAASVKNLPQKTFYLKVLNGSFRCCIVDSKAFRYPNLFSIPNTLWQQMQASQTSS